MASDVDPREAEFQAQMEALRRDFLAGLPARRQALASAWAGCLAGSGDGAWLALRDAAHKLAGSAPCYGLDVVGQRACELDRLLSGPAACRDVASAMRAAERTLAAVDRAIRA